jgi:DNA repair protein RadC
MQPEGHRRPLIDSLSAAEAFFAPTFDRARDERLHVGHLDAGMRLIGVRIRYAAAGMPVEFAIRGIIADAIQLGSAALILAHNHPSGDPTPSATDIETMRSLVQVARPLGLVVRDHLVFGSEGRFVSFRQSGLL